MGGRLQGCVGVYWGGWAFTRMEGWVRVYKRFTRVGGGLQGLVGFTRSLHGWVGFTRGLQGWVRVYKGGWGLQGVYKGG